MPLDEKSLRRPEFAGGVPIRLADGQDWTFPKPVLELFPAFGPDGSVRLAERSTFGLDYEDKLEAFLKAAEGADELRELMGLAAFLLRVNYDLGPADLSRLLRYRPGDETSLAMWQQVANVAGGVAANPPSPIGDESN